MRAITHCFGLARRHAAALYAPPSHRRFWLRSADFCEFVGLKLDLRRAAGVILIEATKLVHATPDSGARASVKGPLEVLEGLAGAGAKPATGRAARHPPSRSRPLLPIAARTR